MAFSGDDRLDRSYSATQVEHLQRVHRVMQYIHEHLGRDLDLAALAKIANLSPPHLNVVFRGIMGESLYQYLKRLRLERAAFFLHFTKEPILDVAMACGFDSHEGFTRAFTKAYGCSPRAFRADPLRPVDLPAKTNAHYRAAGLTEELHPIPDLGRTLAVDIVELPAIRLACMRHHGPYEKAHTIWPRLLWWAFRRGRLNADVVLFGICYDDELITPPEMQRYDAALGVEDDFVGDGQVMVMTLEAGRFARCAVVGTFADYWRASDAFANQWLPNSGHALREMYMLDRYHLAGDLRNPFRFLETALRKFHVDMHIPIGPGPFGRSILA